jgi:hypothetical protein
VTSSPLLIDVFELGYFVEHCRCERAGVFSCVSCRRMQCHRYEEDKKSGTSPRRNAIPRVRWKANQTGRNIVHTPFGRGGKEEAWDVLLGQF